jgi:hypothetical protein
MEASNNRNNPQVGFSETLHKEAPNIAKSSNNSCRDIFEKGGKVRTVFSFPSEFPKITRTKSIKGGRRRRKNARKSRRYKYSRVHPSVFK